MSVVEPGTGNKALIERVQAILLRPSPTWEVIDTEPATIGSLFRRYACILAVIPPLAALIGGQVFGYGAFGVTFRPNIAAALVGAVVQYGLSLLAVYILGLIIEALAPSFDGQKDRLKAMKVAVYSMTASWVAGVFALVPALALIGGLIGLYGLYLLYTGLPRVMKSPKEKTLGYTAVAVICAIVLSFIIGMVTTTVGGLGAMGAMGRLADGGKVSGELKLPGGTKVDLGALEAASKDMERAAKQLEEGAVQGAVEPISPDVLKAQLPSAIAGFARSEISSASGGAAGISGSNAEASYEKGDARLRVSITDLGAAGALAGIASAFNVNSTSESDGRYEKIGKVDGRMTTESYDRSSRHGEYSVLVGNRIMIQAEGDQVSMDELKAAVAAVNPGKLEGLTRGG